MPLLIDGYNLLHASGVLPRGRGPATLKRARQALLHFLANSLAEDESAGAVVVFDAAGAPPGLPTEYQHGPIRVLFARGKAEADDLIEELIAADFAPRRLLVVSSDHRLQRAARRRRARSVDADVWYHQVVQRRGRPAPPPGPTAEKPSPPQTPGETADWLKHFAIDDIESLVGEPPKRAPPAPASSPDAMPTESSEPAAGTGNDDPQDKPPESFGRGVFPDDYFDDLPDDPLD